MIYSTLLVAVSAIAGFASAQNATGSFTSCCNIDPNSVKADLRLSWCRAQQNTCPETCSNGQTSVNSCDSNTLTYSCKCLTGNTPNISDYSQTLPSLECDEWKGQCTAAHPNDLSGQTFCQSFTCGSKNASLTTGGGSSASSSASASGSSTTGTAKASSTSSGSATSTSKAAAAALSVAKDYGTGAVAIGMLALFGLGL